MAKTNEQEEKSKVKVETKPTAEQEMHKGEKAVELAIRQEPASGTNLPHDGTKRGNPEIKDSYFFSGLKLLVHLGRVR